MAKSPNRLKASIVDLTFVIWAAAVPFALGARLLNSDGDFARHLRMGYFILEGGLRQIDSFAHTHTGPFLTTEWLSQVMLALVHRAGGLATVNVLVGVILGASYALVVLFMLRRGVDPLLAYGTAMVAAVLGAPHWVARPHMMTYLALALLLHMVAGRTRPGLWLFAPFFALWANFHGGFVLGLMILGALLAGALAEAWIDADNRAKWLGDARYHATALAIGLAAASVNPMGVGLQWRIVRHLGDSYLLNNTAEFLSPDFHELWGRMLLVLIVGILTAYAIRKERLSLQRFAVILLLLAGSLFARRNGPLFGLFALPLVAIDMDALFRSVNARWLARIRNVFHEGEKIAVRGRYAPWFAVALVAFAISGGSVAGKQLIRTEFDGGTFPVDAVAAARDAGLEGNMFNYFTWGGYVLWAWPEQRIYIDGMTDFLGEDVLRSYSKVYWLDPGWEDELTKHDVAFALFPTRSRVIHALRETSGWHTWYEDSVATILTRDERPPGLQ